MSKKESKGKGTKKSKDMIFRDLDNYKGMHAALAQKNGVEVAFHYARTLTQARKILFGDKPKNNSCKCRQANCKRGKGGKASAC